MLNKCVDNARNYWPRVNDIGKNNVSTMADYMDTT
jgi:hypothetical protein